MGVKLHPIRYFVSLFTINSQITNARIPLKWNLKFKRKLIEFKVKLSMLVGISEAICVLIIFIQGGATRPPSPAEGGPTFESSLKGHAAPLRGAWWPSARLRRPKGHLAVQPLRSLPPTK